MFLSVSRSQYSMSFNDVCCSRCLAWCSGLLIWRWMSISTPRGGCGGHLGGTLPFNAGSRCRDKALRVAVTLLVLQGEGWSLGKLVAFRFLDMRILFDQSKTFLPNLLGLFLWWWVLNIRFRGVARRTSFPVLFLWSPCSLLCGCLMLSFVTDELYLVKMIQAG